MKCNALLEEVAWVSLVHLVCRVLTRSMLLKVNPFVTGSSRHGNGLLYSKPLPCLLLPVTKGLKASHGHVCCFLQQKG